jgi:hypothetical protein
VATPPADPGKAASTEPEPSQSEPSSPQPPSGRRWFVTQERSDEPKLVRLGPRYDPRPLRERTRSWVARILVLLLVAVSLSLVIFTAVGELAIEDARDLAGVVLAPLVVLAGTVFGFYYSGHSGD